jgi:RimJ/RimL family protein N-acetyltransferase
LSLEIVTSRLVLRPWRREDRELFAEMSADPVVMEHYPSVLSREESDARADQNDADFAKLGFGKWAVEIPGETSFAGYIGLTVPAFEASFTPCVEVGWRLARRFWGCGYATEGARAALDFGFGRLGLAEIVSFTVPANTRSIRVMEKIGMKFVGEFDHPALEEGDRLRRHLLYRIEKARLNR